jgi:hypothetical protein
MPRFKVTAVYGCQVETTVEAEDREDAEYQASGALDDLAAQNVMRRKTTVEEV